MRVSELTTSVTASVNGERARDYRAHPRLADHCPLPKIGPCTDPSIQIVNLRLDLQSNHTGGPLVYPCIPTGYVYPLPSLPLPFDPKLCANNLSMFESHVMLLTDHDLALAPWT